MKTKVVIPYADTDGRRTADILSFHGAVDRRRLKREVRKYVVSKFGRHPTVEWIAKVPQYYEDKGDPVPVTQEDIEKWIERIQDDTPESEGDTSSQGDTSC